MAGPRKKPDDHLTGAQLRAALGILNMSVLELSERTGLAAATIKRALEPTGPAPINVANARLIVATLEAAGVTLLPVEGSLGAGARLSTPDVLPLTRRRRKPAAADDSST
jgi:hypothetical protein